MDSAHDVPDSTDWLNTPLKDFSGLENALHCQICKEFYETPMITTCNHTFCSKCIRTSLSADGKCPACRAADQASKLRNNWALQEVVSAFLAARPAALAVARKAQEEAEAPERPAKRKRTAISDAEDIAEAEASTRTTRSKSRRVAASQGSEQEAIEIGDSDDEKEFRAESRPKDGLVECPLGCGQRMNEEDVFGHLDRCEDEKKQKRTLKSRIPINGFGISRSSSGPGATPKERINELNYSMMKESALSKRLKDLGIPSWGSKQLMVSRHREWVNIWNANCDSMNSRTKRELLHDLDVWERTQGGKAPNANGLSSAIMRKDFDGDAYSKKHQDEFSRLIADAKRKKNNPATEEARAKDEQHIEAVIANGDDQMSPFFKSSSQADMSANDSQDPALKKVGTMDTMPCLNNPDAMSSTQGRVEQSSHGGQTKSSTNEDSSNSDSNRLQDRGSSADMDLTHAETGSPSEIPANLHLIPPKKVPMFAVLENPIPDVNQGA